MKPAQLPHFDLIGDINGHYDKLARLLHRLGYHPHGDSFRHPEGRKIILLGNYTDRVPKVGQGLLLIGAIVEADKVPIERFYVAARTLLATNPLSEQSLFIDYLGTGKLTLRWIMVRYQVIVDKAIAIKNDSNDWCRENNSQCFIIDLHSRVTRVSLETNRIVASLPALNEHTTAPLKS